MPQTILAIDIGSYSIKLALAERAFGEFSLNRFDEIFLIHKEGLTYEQTIVLLLARFFEENDIHYDTAVASLSGLQCSFRRLDFPFTQIKKIDSALEFELEQFVPFPIESLWVDYLMVEKGEKESKILAAYTLKEELVKFLNLLNEAGCDPRYVSVESVNLANLYQSGLLPPEGNYAILDIGHSKTNLCLMQGGNLREVRTISMGGKAITEAVAKAYEINFAQAEELKIRKGQISPFETEDKLSAVIQKVIEDLLIQIKQTLFAFYEKGEKTIEAIYLSGGTSRLPGIDQFISSYLRLNVSPLDLLDLSYTHISDPESARPIIASCIASIFKGVFPSKTTSLNFRRGEFSYRRDLEAISGHFRQIAVLPFAAFVLGILYFAISLYLLGGQETKMNKSVANLISQGMQIQPPKGNLGAQGALSFVNSKITDANEKLKKMSGEGNVSAFESLRLISANLPARKDIKLDVDDLNIGVDHARLEGKTVSYEAIDKIKTALAKVPTFKNVQTSNVRKGTQDELKFSLSFDIGAPNAQDK